MSERYKKTIFNTIMLYILSFAKIIFPLVLLPYLTRVLSVECYGAVSYVKSVIAYAQIAIDFGFILSSVKDIVKANKEKKCISEIISDTILAKLILSVVAFVVILVVSFAIPLLREYRLFLILSFGVPFLSSFLLDFLFRGIEKMHIVSIIYVFMKTISTILTILFVKGDQMIILIPVLDMISSVCAIVLTWVIAIKMGYRLVASNMLKAFNKIKDSTLYFANSVASTAFGALNTVLIGIFIKDLEHVAYWSVSMQLVGAVQTMYTPISNGIYPYMIKKKDLSLIKKVILIFMPVVFGGIVFCYFFSPQILTIISGKKYVDATGIFRLLLPILAFSFPVAILGWPTLGAIDKVKQINIATLSGACIQITGLFLLILFDEFNLITVAIVRNISEIVMFSVLVFFVIKFKSLFNSKNEVVINENI